MHATHLLATDLQRSVVSGLIGTARTYTPYGFSAHQDGALSAFCGVQRDPLTGGYHLGNGFRQFSPTLMRFHSPDGMSPFAAGGINAYAYCAGDPINRIDPNAQWWQRVLGASSSLATATGAILRTAKNEILRLQHVHAQSTAIPATNTTSVAYNPPPLLTRIGNTAYFYTGGVGVSGNIMQGVENGWMDNALISFSRGLGVTGSVGNITGGGFSNFETARYVWNSMGQPGVPSSRVVFGTAAEVTGARMLYDAGAYLLGQGRQMAQGLGHAFRAGVNAWSNWMRGIKSIREGGA